MLLVRSWSSHRVVRNVGFLRSPGVQMAYALGSGLIVRFRSDALGSDIPKGLQEDLLQMRIVLRGGEASNE
jgi:hypothetical protein